MSNTNPRPNVASFTSAYWDQGPNFVEVSGSLPIARNLGFMFDIPRRQPIAGPWFYGEGRNYIAGDRREVYRSDPQYTAVDNVIPTLNGKPMVDISDPAYTFDRSRFTI